MFNKTEIRYVEHLLSEASENDCFYDGEPKTFTTGKLEYFGGCGVKWHTITDDEMCLLLEKVRKM